MIGILPWLGFGSAAPMMGLSFAFSPGVIALAFGFAIFIGLAFGIFPAYRASHLNPIDALRQD